MSTTNKIPKSGQMTLLDYMDEKEIPGGLSQDRKSHKITLNKKALHVLKKYTKEDYLADLDELGIEKTWDRICSYVMQYGDNSGFLQIDRFGEMYEIALALIDKEGKKRSGQYYTPEDVTALMNRWFMQIPGENVCDVGCGTGCLILKYLELIGEKKALEMILGGHLYLYESDPLALRICHCAIRARYEIEDEGVIHCILGDFLSSKIHLPQDAKVIINPPYAAIKGNTDEWEKTAVYKESMELYAVFMEKIFKEAHSAVIITPFSFVSGTKFYQLRKCMCEQGSGFIVSFDNVPGNIFCGRKHGIFNSNTANSGRAAITVFRKGRKKGYRVSPLIRFKNEERENLLKPRVLESILPKNYQTVNEEKTRFAKVSMQMEGIYDTWMQYSQKTIADLALTGEGEYRLEIPNTCRYFTTASAGKLKRAGSIVLHAKDKDSYDFLYCFANSSFLYWWWRIYDGAITYSLKLLLSVPLPYDALTAQDRVFFEETRSEMEQKERDYIIKKKNAGEVQENVKFPELYRKKINERILQILKREEDASVLETIHQNHFF